jgi:hypothetical protein
MLGFKPWFRYVPRIPKDSKKYAKDSAKPAAQK